MMDTKGSYIIAKGNYLRQKLLDYFEQYITLRLNFALFDFKYYRTTGPKDSFKDPPNYTSSFQPEYNFEEIGGN